MTTSRALSVTLRDRPQARLPERGLRAAVLDAADRTREDGLDRAVLFEIRRRRFLIDAWPQDERPGLIVVADITTE
jgi:hypothetical protein